MSFDSIRVLIAGLAAIIIVLFTASKFVKKSKIFTPKFIAKTGIFAAISIILYTVPFLKFGVPIFPSFLEFHFDEVPALIAGFAYGPISGCLVILIKTIVKLPISNTACVGELADLLYSTVFVLTSALIYKKHRSFKGALVALIIGSLVQNVAASLFTTYVMLDFYSVLYHIPKVVILNMCKAASGGLCKDLNFGYMFIVSAPFNAIKDLAVSIITLVLYKRLHRLIDRIG